MKRAKFFVGFSAGLGLIQLFKWLGATYLWILFYR